MGIPQAGFLLDKYLDGFRTLFDNNTIQTNGLGAAIKERRYAGFLNDMYKTYRDNLKYDKSEKSEVAAFLNEIASPSSSSLNRVDHIRDFLSTPDVRQAMNVPFDVVDFLVGFYGSKPNVNPNIDASSSNNAFLDNLNGMWDNKLRTGTVFGKKHRLWKISDSSELPPGAEV